MSVRIHAVSTRPRGRGGIASAVSGLADSSVLREAGVEFIESHAEGQRLATFLSALSLVRARAGPGSLFWFHCGPWVSIARKRLLASVARSRGAKVVFQLHSITFHHYLAVPWMRALLLPFLRSADGVIVLTPWWRDQLLRCCDSLDRKIFVAPNVLEKRWIRLASFPRDVRDRPDGDPVRILSMARLVPAKGVDSVIRSMLCLPARFHLTIAGDGPMYAELQRAVDHAGLSQRVKLIGWVDCEEKTKLLTSSDVFCLPSRNDAFGMGYIEAMAAGLPVVAMRRQAIPDVVPDGVAGRLLDDDSAESIAAAVQDCWKHRREMSAGGKNVAQRRYDGELVGTRILRYFDDLDASQRDTEATGDIASA